MYVPIMWILYQTELELCFLHVRWPVMEYGRGQWDYINYYDANFALNISEIHIQLTNKLLRVLIVISKGAIIGTRLINFYSLFILMR